jgi:hypothetical protein
VKTADLTRQEGSRCSTRKTHDGFKNGGDGLYILFLLGNAMAMVG